MERRVFRRAGSQAPEEKGGEGYLLSPGENNLNREPVRAGRFVGAYDAGLSAAVAAMAGLVARRTTHPGQHVDISKHDALLSLLRIQMTRYPNEAFVVSRATAKHRGGAAIMPCLDGYVLVEAIQKHQWHGLVRFLGSPEWAQDERFRTESSRFEHQAELQQLLGQAARDRTKQTVYHAPLLESLVAGLKAEPPQVAVNTIARWETCEYGLSELAIGKETKRKE